MSGSYEEEVRRKAERMARARREPRSAWVVLSRAGTLGWQFALLLVGCTLAGYGIARWQGDDRPTLIGIAMGVGLACWQAYRTLQGVWEDE